METMVITLLIILITALTTAVLTYGMVTHSHRVKVRNILKYLRALERECADKENSMKYYIIQDMIIEVMFNDKCVLGWEDEYYQEHDESPNVQLIEPTGSLSHRSTAA